MPVFVDLTKGNVHEVNIAKGLSFPRGSMVVIDRGYTDMNLKKGRSKMRFVKNYITQILGLKISLIALLVFLIVGMPFVIFGINNAKKDIYAMNEKRWELLTEAVFRSLKTAMLEGKAKIVSNMLNEFSLINEAEALEVVTMDGTRTFDKRHVKVLEPETIKRIINNDKELNIYKHSEGKRVFTHLKLYIMLKDAKTVTGKTRLIVV